jgi:hypothetical protein
VLKETASNAYSKKTGSLLAKIIELSPKETGERTMCDNLSFWPFYQFLDFNCRRNSDTQTKILAITIDTVRLISSVDMVRCLGAQAQKCADSNAANLSPEETSGIASRRVMGRT